MEQISELKSIYFVWEALKECSVKHDLEKPRKGERERGSFRTTIKGAILNRLTLSSPQGEFKTAQTACPQDLRGTVSQPLVQLLGRSK